jgi:uncharacterized protein involved in exopolysaccharide biosynthesis
LHQANGPPVFTSGPPGGMAEEHGQRCRVPELVWLGGGRWYVTVLTMVVAASGAHLTATFPRHGGDLGQRSAAADHQNQISMAQLPGPERYSAEQEKVLGTRRLAQRVVDRLGLASHPGFAVGDPANQLRGMLRINREETSNIIVLSLVSTDPASAAEWLNILIEEYIAASIEDNLGRTRKVYEVIQSQLEPLRDQLQVSEELMQFRERENALLFADQDKNVISEQVNTLTTEYAGAKAERIRLETMISALGRMGSDQASETSLPDALKNTTIEELRKQRNQVQLDLADKLRTLKEGHPVIKELRSRLTELKAGEREQAGVIRTALQTDFNIVSQRERSLYANIQQLKDQSIELSKQTMEYDRLRREYDQNKAFLEEMLARSKEADITSSAPMNNIRVIEPARPAKRPFSPNVGRSLAVAAIFGLLVGVGLVIGFHYLDQTIRTPDQVERYLGLEVLAALPKLTGDTAGVLKVVPVAANGLLLAARGRAARW